MPSVAFKKKNVSMPEVANPTVKIEGNLNKAMAQEKRWLDHAMMLMEKKRWKRMMILLGQPTMPLKNTLLIPYFLLSHSSCCYFMKRLPVQQ